MDKRSFVFALLLSCVFVVFPFFYTKAQGSEEEVKVKADKLFEDEAFSQAMPLYSQLVSIYPKDAMYNYRFGVCMLMATEEKEKAIDFIYRGVKESANDKLVYFYMARAYHINYQFDKAIYYYAEFKKIATKSALSKYLPDQQIEACRNGKTLLGNISDLAVLEKKQLPDAEYFRSYDLSDVGGKLLVKPEEFQTAYDRKKKEKTIVYLSAAVDVVYFSSYGEDGKNGKDIYLKRRLASGEWGNAEEVPGLVNTPFDEETPFLHPNGKVLYFASKGHNSMGGYDIFKSTFNEATKSWGKPVNMQFPINTPGDEFLFVTNKEESTAFLSSDRATPTGIIGVYKIKTERKPLDVNIVRGIVLKNSRGEYIRAKISISRADNKEKIYETVSSVSRLDSIDYYTLPNVPNGARIIMKVEADGYNRMEETIQMPTLSAFKPLKQELSYDETAGKWRLNNIFNDPPSENDYLLALDYIKNKAKMDPSGTTSKKDEISFADVNKGKVPEGEKLLTPAEKLAIAKEQALNADKESKELALQSGTVYLIAKSKNDEAQAKIKEAEAILEKANTIEDETQRQDEFVRAKATKDEADLLTKQTVAAFELADKLKADAEEKKKEFQMATEMVKNIDGAIKRNAQQEVNTKYKEQWDQLQEFVKQEFGTSEAYNTANGVAENKQKELTEVNKKMNDVKQEIASLEGEKSNLEEQLKVTKNKDSKAALQEQINDLTTEENTKKEELAKVEEIQTKKQKEVDLSRSQAQYINSIAADLKTKKPATAPEVATVNKTVLSAKVKEYKENKVSKKDSVFAKISSPTGVVLSTTTVDAGITVKAEGDSKSIDSQTTVPTAITGTNSATSSKTTIESATKTTEVKTVATKEQNDAIQAIQSGKEPIAVNTSTTIASPVQNEVKKDTTTRQVPVVSPTTVVKSESKDSSQNKQVGNEPPLVVTNTVSATTDITPVEENKKEKPLLTITPLGNNSNLKTVTQQLDQDSTQYNSYNEKYAAQLISADQVNNETDKESLKAELYKRWADSLNTQLEKEKQTLAVTKGKKEKNALQQKINRLQQDKDAKQILAEAATEKVNALQTETLAVNTNSVVPADSVKTAPTKATAKDSVVTKTPGTESAVNAIVNISPAQLQTKYSDQLKDTTGISDPIEKEQAKALIFANWVKETDTALTLKRTALSAVKDAKARQQSQREIRQLEQQQARVRTRLKSSEDRIEKLKTVATLATQDQVKNAGDNVSPTGSDNSKTVEPIATNTTVAVPTNISTTQPSTNVDGKTNNTTPTVTEKPVIVDAGVTKGELVKVSPASNIENNYKKEVMRADVLANEAEAEKKQAAEWRIEAQKETNPAIKAGLLVQADSIEREALTHVTMAGELKAVANKKVKDKNVELLATLSERSANKEAAHVITANGLQDEAKKLTDQAAIYRDSANAEENLLTRQSYLRIAAEKEQAAVFKQNQAVDALVKGEPALAAVVKEFDEKNEAPEIIAVRNSKEYKDLGDQSDQAAKDAEKDSLTAKEFRIKAEEQLALANKQKAEADTTADPLRKKELEDQANRNLAAAKFSTAQADSMSSLSENSKATFKSKLKEMALLVNNIKNEITEKNKEPVTIVKTTPRKNKNGFTQNITSDITSQHNGLQLSAGDVFKISDRSLYNDANPIPMNPTLPDGLIYTVQIGVYRNKVRPEVFGGLNPLMGSSMNSGATKYCVGLFTTFESASYAKGEIQKIGYRDAFVIVYYNGKKISLGEALAMQKAGTSPADLSSTSPSTATTTVSAPSNVLPSKEIAEIKGLLYTVQVGVYARPARKGMLYNIQPLYTEKMNNGRLKYTAGIYDNLEAALKAKTAVVNMGVKDAFVIAYNNGKLVSFAEARRIETTKDPLTLPNDQEINKMPDQSGATALPKAKVADSPVPTTTNAIVFKVQLGAYKEQVPVDMANKFLVIKDKGINTYRDDAGLTIYTVGNFSNYEEANKLKNDIIAQQGITGAFVVAYNNGKKITVEEANQLLINKQ